MNILITGTGTLVGNNILSLLSRNKKFKLIGTYRTHRPSNFNKRVKLIKYDLKNKPIFLKKENKIDALIHCASAIPSYNLTDDQIIKINVDGFRNLLDACIKKKCSKIVLLSTMSIYGKINSKTISENTKINKPSAYGHSKLSMEKYLKKKTKNNNISYSIFRLPGVLGFKSKHNFLSNMLMKIKKNKKIYFSNPKLKFNNLVHVKNLSQIVSKSISINEKEIYNVGSMNKILFKNVIKLFYRKLKKKLNYEIVNSDSKGFNINVRKIQKKYKIFSTKKSIEIFCRENKFN